MLTARRAQRAMRGVTLYKKPVNTRIDTICFEMVNMRSKVRCKHMCSMHSHDKERTRARKGLASDLVVISCFHSSATCCHCLNSCVCYGSDNVVLVTVGLDVKNRNTQTLCSSQAFPSPDHNGRVRLKAASDARCKPALGGFASSVKITCGVLFACSCAGLRRQNAVHLVGPVFPSFALDAVFACNLRCLWFGVSHWLACARALSALLVVGILRTCSLWVRTRRTASLTAFTRGSAPARSASLATSRSCATRLRRLCTSASVAFGTCRTWAKLRRRTSRSFATSTASRTMLSF
jgi:hypothetical protein